MKCCHKTCSKTLAMMGAIAFIVCHFWQYAIPEAVRPLHADLLRTSVLGWSGMNLTSLLLGVVQWAIWGYLIGTAFFIFKKWTAGSCSEHKKNVTENV